MSEMDVKLVLENGDQLNPTEIRKSVWNDRYVFNNFADVILETKTRTVNKTQEIYAVKISYSKRNFNTRPTLMINGVTIELSETKIQYKTLETEIPYINLISVYTLPKLSPPPNCIAPTMRKTPDNMVSIIILSYNTIDVTVNCITSVLENTVHPFELFVVDNGSRDGTVNYLRSEPYLTLMALNKNLGFSKANNLAIRCARGKYVCLLNSDTVVRTRGWLKHMVNLAEKDERIGTVGAKLLYADGRIQHVGGGIHGTNPYHPYDKYPNNITIPNQDVPYNTGACLLITRTALDLAGLLDEDYPFGFEDVDYGLKVVEKGLRNVVCYEAVLTHLWAYTQRKTGKGITTTSLTIYHRKWNHKLDEIAKKVTLDWGTPYG